MKEAVHFASCTIETKTEYGDFDLKTGVFTVNKSGIFQLNFNGIAFLTESSPTCQFEMIVDGYRKSVSYLDLASSNGAEEVVLSALLQLEIGQKLSVIRISGGLCHPPDTRITRFSCVVFC